MQKTCKVLSLLLFINLTACSTLSTEDSTSSSLPPVTPVAETHALPAPPAPPADQNTIREMNLSQSASNNELIGGSIERNMDNDDKLKMSRALDKAPGKSTAWQNGRTGITYTVTPVKKVVLKNNPFCREYRTTATFHDQSQTVMGTACVAADGNWHTISK